jgi:hypothetical protein
LKFLAPFNEFYLFAADGKGKVFSTIEDKTAVQFKAPRTRQATAKEAVLSKDQPQVDEPQPGGSGVPYKRRRASAAAAVLYAAQVDEPQNSREPSQKRRKAGPLPQDDEEDDDKDIKFWVEGGLCIGGGGWVGWLTASSQLSLQYQCCLVSC